MNVHPQPPAGGDIRESFLLVEQESPLDIIMVNRNVGQDTHFLMSQGHLCQFSSNRLCKIKGHG